MNLLFRLDVVLRSIDDWKEHEQNLGDSGRLKERYIKMVNNEIIERAREGELVEIFRDYDLIVKFTFTDFGNTWCRLMFTSESDESKSERFNFNIEDNRPSISAYILALLSDETSTISQSFFAVAKILEFLESFD